LFKTFISGPAFTVHAIKNNVTARRILAWKVGAARREVGEKERL